MLASQFTLCCCLGQCFYVSSYIEASVTTNLAHLLWGYGMKLIFIWFLSEFYLIFIWFFTDFFEWRTTLYLIFIWFFRETQNNVIWFLSEFFLIFLETENNVIWFLSEFYLIFSSSEQNAHVDSGTPPPRYQICPYYRKYSSFGAFEFPGCSSFLGVRVSW